jgi:hypothetical protein
MGDGFELLQDVEDALFSRELIVFCPCCACAQFENSGIDLLAVVLLNCLVCVGSYRPILYSLPHISPPLGSIDARICRYQAPLGPLASNRRRKSETAACFGLP